MPSQPYEALIFSISDLFTRNRIEAEAVNQSLELICQGFSFDCGLIYEADGPNHFRLREHYSPSALPLHLRFRIDGILAESWNHMARHTISYIDEHEEGFPYSPTLLDFFSASSMAITSLLDEDMQINTLAVFINTSPKDTRTAEERKILSTLLSMMAQYLAIRMYKNRLTQARTSLESILDNTGIDIYVNDYNNHDILYVNKSMAAPYGGQERFLGKKCWQVLYPGQTGPCGFCPQNHLIDAYGNPTKVYTWDYQRPFDGSWFRVFSAAFRWIDGRLAHVVSSADITDNKKKEATIEYMANYDPLTKLPNRRKLVKDCELRIDRSTETEKGYLMFFDIDGFKAINDNLGHDAGDEFLVKLGGFFTDIPVLKDSIYRNGGDEFVAIIGGETITKEDIRRLADSILSRFKRPWKLKGGEVSCNTSIGVACYPMDGCTAEELLRKSDMAMYHVKKSGGGGVCFAYQMEQAPCP